MYLIDIAGLSPVETAEINLLLGGKLNQRSIKLAEGFPPTTISLFDRRPLHVAMRWESPTFESDFFRINEHRGQREWTLIVAFERRAHCIFSVRSFDLLVVPVDATHIFWPAEDAITRIERGRRRKTPLRTVLHLGTTTIVERTNPAD